MSVKTTTRAALAGALVSLVTPLWAQDAPMITVKDAYARAASPAAKAGAAFLVLENNGPKDDRLIGVSSPVAKKVELHTHIMDDGVMLMRHDEDGFEIPAGGMHVLERGADHIMFMGLTTSFTSGSMVPVTLEFEYAEPMTIEIEVDLDR